MSNDDDDDGQRPSEETLAEVVFGSELDVPVDVKHVGPWKQSANCGEFREFQFLPLYVHPGGLGVAGLVGRQWRTGQTVYGIRVNVSDDLSSEEAATLKSALGDLIANVDQLNRQD